MKVKAENLGMTFNDGERKVPVFSGLELEIESGSSVAIVGASGVGKTTLLHLLGALELPTSGQIILGDKCITDNSLSNNDRAEFRGQKLGFVFQFHHLLPEFDALENVSLALRLRGIAKAEAEVKAGELLTKVGLKDRFSHRPGMLSGGEQQRVAIARALVGKPGLILADEPTGNLDGQTGLVVSDLLIELQKEHGSTMIVVTHSLDLAKKMDLILELVSDGLVRRL